MSFLPILSLPSNALSFAFKRTFGPSDKLRLELTTTTPIYILPPIKSSLVPSFPNLTLKLFSQGVLTTTDFKWKPLSLASYYKTILDKKQNLALGTANPSKTTQHNFAYISLLWTFPLSLPFLKKTPWQESKTERKK